MSKGYCVYCNSRLGCYLNVSPWADPKDIVFTVTVDWGAIRRPQYYCVYCNGRLSCYPTVTLCADSEDRLCDSSLWPLGRRDFGYHQGPAARQRLSSTFRLSGQLLTESYWKVSRCVCVCVTVLCVYMQNMRNGCLCLDIKHFLLPNSPTLPTLQHSMYIHNIEIRVWICCPPLKISFISEVYWHMKTKLKSNNHQHVIEYTE